MENEGRAGMTPEGGEVAQAEGSQQPPPKRPFRKDEGLTPQRAHSTRRLTFVLREP